MASINTDGFEASEVVSTHTDTFDTKDRSRPQHTSLCTYKATFLADGSHERVARYGLNSTAHKRKAITTPGVSKRNRTDWEMPIKGGKDIHKTVQDPAEWHARDIAEAAPVDVSAYALSEPAQVKIKYIIAERELRRERAQHGKASDMTIAALLNAGECMRRSLDQKLETMKQFWEQEIKDLIATEKALLSSQESDALRNARSG